MYSSLIRCAYNLTIPLPSPTFRAAVGVYRMPQFIPDRARIEDHKGIGGFLSDLLGDIPDQFGRLRYGVPTSEKERLARTGELPGSPAADTMDSSEADRYASGYLFGRTWPNLSRLIQPAVDTLKTSSLPLFGGESPEMQSYATAGGNAGRTSRGSNLQELIRVARMGR